NLETGLQTSFMYVKGFMYNDEGNILLLHAETIEDRIATQSIKLVHFPDDKVTAIWKGAKAENFVFDASGTRLAFKVTEKIAGKMENSIWYYNIPANKAEKLANGNSKGIDNSWII